MPRFARTTLVMFALLVAASVPIATAAGHRITYLTISTAYIDAGRDDGVAVGASVTVVRAGKIIATLLVTDVSSNRAACTIQSSTEPVAIGDAIRYSPVKAPTPVDTTRTAPPSRTFSGKVVTGTDEPAPTRAVSWARRNGLRGQIGVRYLGIIDQGGVGGNLSQPSADIRVDGARVGHSPFDLQVDVRARHSYQSVPGGDGYDNGQTRVYRMNSRWHSPHDRLRVTVGRQFSSSLTSISTFDGAQLEYDFSPRWGMGTFAGTQPSMDGNYAFSTDVREYGAFARLRSKPRSTTRWEAVVAGIGSYQFDKINREYMALVGRVNAPRLSVMAQQEIDVNRGWKHDAENSQVSLTSTFATARYRLTPHVDLDAGYDNRRNVRLYRDYISPETLFDDSYRRGTWGGVGVRLTAQYRLGFSARSSGGGSSGDATSYTMTGSANRLTPLHLSFRLRSTRYTNTRLDGWMHTLSGNVPVGPRWLMELYGGVRDEKGRGAVMDTNTSWFGGNLDVGVGQNWYINMSAERNGEGQTAYDQVYTSVSWRF